MNKKDKKNKKKFLLLFLLLLLMVPISFVLFSPHSPKDSDTGNVMVTDQTHRTILPQEPEKIPENSTQRSPVTKDLQNVSKEAPAEPKEPAPPMPPEASSVEPLPEESRMTPFSVSLEALPSEPVPRGSAMKRSPPKAFTLGGEGTPMLKLCAGEPITPCENCRLTHHDFALLLVDLLALVTTELYEEAFDILASLQIAPVNGWATADPQKLITPREMEEVRCSISLAFKDGSIGVEPSTVTVALNRFLEESDISIQTAEDSGVTKGDSSRSAETGYQGGEEGVLSPSL